MIEAIRAGLAARADPDRAPDMQAYMQSEMPFLGVQKPARTALARELFTPLDAETRRATVVTLWRDATYREERYMALALRRQDRTDLALLYDCIEASRDRPEFFPRKGIGWALRAYAWIDPDEIERYCATHELSALSRREALRNVARIRGAS